MKFCSKRNSYNSTIFFKTGTKKPKKQDKKYMKVKVGDHSRAWPEGSLFNSYYTEV